MHADGSIQSWRDLCAVGISRHADVVSPVAVDAGHDQNSGWPIHGFIVMHPITSDHLDVTTADGHRLGVYRARPNLPVRGSVLIVQEIFGVSPHIQAVADAYAAAGYEALAPQLFDRIAPNILVPYADWATGLAHARSLDPAQTMLDLEACLSATLCPNQVGLVGFCWGGQMAYLAACRLSLRAVISYYGGGIPACLAERPRCPLQFHFGAEDGSIPASDIEQIRIAVPQAEFHLYPAGHAFNNADRASFDAKSAALSLDRALAFLRVHLD